MGLCQRTPNGCSGTTLWQRRSGLDAICKKENSTHLCQGNLIKQRKIGTESSKTWIQSLSTRKKVRLVKRAGQFRTLTHQLKKMIEPITTATVALVSGGFILMGRVNTNIKELDRRIDRLELRVAESYVSKSDFTAVLDRVELHMTRIDEKLDRITSINSN